eukprot:3683560-Rhodomonas_salina.2
MKSSRLLFRLLRWKDVVSHFKTQLNLTSVCLQRRHRPARPSYPGGTRIPGVPGYRAQDASECRSLAKKHSTRRVASRPEGTRVPDPGVTRKLRVKLPAVKRAPAYGRSYRLQENTKTVTGRVPVYQYPGYPGCGP